MRVVFVVMLIVVLVLVMVGRVVAGDGSRYMVVHINSTV